jgi:hypothetical protein
MSYHYVEQCCLTDPGHQILDADYYIASGNSTPRIEVTAVMLDDEVIERRWNGSVLRGGVAEWDRCATGLGPPLGVGKVRPCSAWAFSMSEPRTLNAACAHNRIPHTTSTKGDSDDIRQQFSGRPDLAA